MNHSGHRAGVSGTGRSWNPCFTRSQLSITDHLQGNVPSRTGGGTCPCWAQGLFFHLFWVSSAILTPKNSNSCCILGILSTCNAELVWSWILWMVTDSPNLWVLAAVHRFVQPQLKHSSLADGSPVPWGPIHLILLCRHYPLPPFLGLPSLHCATSKLSLNQHPAVPQPLALSHDPCKETKLLQRETHASEKSLQLPGLSMKQELFQAISYHAHAKTVHQPWPKHPYFALVPFCGVQLVLPQCWIFQNLSQNTPMETSASRDALWHSHREPASSAHRNQTPNRLLYQSCKINCQTSLVWWARIERTVLVWRQGGEVLWKNPCLSAKQLDNSKERFAEKKKAASMFIRILTALFLLTLMAQRSNWKLEIVNSKSNSPLKHE